MIRIIRKNRLSEDESGATLIEFAFVAPTFLLMLMGLFDLGYGVFMQSALTGRGAKCRAFCRVGNRGLGISCHRY